MRFVLLDTNMLIGAFDTDENNPDHLNSRKIVTELIEDSNVQIAITPLIRYEVLRGVKRISREKMQTVLNGFESFEINADIAYQSADIFYELELLSNDKDIQKIANFANNC